jgi:D-alanyl-lipoteichoic acid acyltransferase DltB (MBOAT superfamily)
MAFDSFAYLAFLAVAIAAARLLRERLATIWLVVASMLFYGLVVWWYPLLLVGVTGAAWYCGEIARQAESRRHRRLAVGAGIFLSLAPLLVFKYASQWLPFAASPQKSTWLDPASWAMPVGLSFYALQGIAWVVDCGRGDVAKSPPLCRFTLFFSFFPKLSAGPILRHDDFFPESRKTGWSSALLWESCTLFVFGLFKKVVLADNTAVAANALFAAPDTSSSLALLGMLAYSMQIYCDFAGYTDMAIASGLLLGIRLPKNFHWPYLATNPAEFWRRWHITLSQWLRDYVYLTLPGLRARKPLAMYGGLLLTMVLCGVWHGSTLPFAIWGLYWGLLLLGYRILEARLASFWNAAKLPSWAVTLLATAGMQMLIATGWVFFRAESIADAGRVLGSLFAGGWDAPPGFSLGEAQWLTMALLAGFWLFHATAVHAPLLRFQQKHAWHPAGVSLLLLLLSAAVVFRVPNAVPFLYFRF